MSYKTDLLNPYVVNVYRLWVCLFLCSDGDYSGGYMDSSLSSNKETLTVESRISSPISLFEQGLDYFRQGRHVEGISFWALARERLPPEKMLLAAMIDAFLESYANYRQTEQAFHQASRNFVEAENKQQKLLAAVEKLLMDPREKSISASSQSSTPAQASNDFQGSRTSHSTQPLVADHGGDQSLQPLWSSSGDCEDHSTLPALTITCFGRFEVKRLGQPVILCQNRNGQAILRYLIAQSDYRATSDSLMGILWPDNEPEVARHKVQVAVSALRRSLNNGYTNDPGGGYIICKNGVYQPNPATSIKTDVDTFLLFYQAGRQRGGEERIAHFEKACHLYKGPFLAEDLYADWTFVRREQLSQKFLTMCHALAKHYLATGHYEAAVHWASAVIEENRCDEEAYRQLMQAYAACGHRSEAIQRFQRCEHILHYELGATPMPETINLFQSILLCQSIPLPENANRAKIERK
jgi:DNA-binding SARP family transcriptional activator